MHPGILNRWNQIRHANTPMRNILIGFCAMHPGESVCVFVMLYRQFVHTMLVRVRGGRKLSGMYTKGEPEKKLFVYLTDAINKA